MIIGLFDFLRPRAQAAEVTPHNQTRVKEIAAAQLAASMRQLPKGRLSSSAGGDWQTLFDFASDSFKGYPDSTSAEVIELLRKAASDDDIAGSLRDLQALINTGLIWEFEAGERATKAAKTALERWAKVVYPGGLPVFVNNQVRELYMAGASSAEWVPSPNRREVAEVVVVPRETVFPMRDRETGRVVYEQRHLAGRVRLHPMTYHYQPIETESETHHGIPVAISAPATLARKTGILAGTQKIINLMGRSALVRALVPPLEPHEAGFASKDDTGYEDALKQYYNDVADLLTNATEMGIWVGPAGIELDATPLTQNASGIGDVMKINQKGVWNASATLPFLRGDVSANYALARVMYPFLTAVADNIQEAITAQLEFGANLHLRLAGIPARAFVKWRPRANAFAIDDAEAKKANAEADKILYGLFGDVYAQRLMSNWDVVDEDAKAIPAWWGARGATKPEAAANNSAAMEPEEVGDG